MKTWGGLWEKIVSEENLRAAWRRVRRGHSRSPAVLEWEGNLEANLSALDGALRRGDWRPGGYRQFKIRDPKPRVVSCAPVGDRVVHHAVCAVLAPVWERGFIARSFACLEGRGSHRACLEAREQARRHPWFLKMDVRRYFDSIPHGRLLETVAARFREREVRALLERLVRTDLPGLDKGKGLPIGNLTSQWLANTYLDGLDHRIAEVWRAGSGYLRYMDDLLVFADSKARCWVLHDAIRGWLADERGLAVKDEATRVAPVSEGVPFLGLRIWPGAWRLSRTRFVRTRRKAAARLGEWMEGALGDAELVQCLRAAEGAPRWFGFKGILDHLDPVAPEEGPDSGSNRVNRGGSWNNNARNCRSANRNNNSPGNRNNNLGFRPVSVRRGPIAATVMAGPHFGRPAPRSRGDEHAPLPAAPVG